jgi:hypothetical protein
MKTTLFVLFILSSAMAFAQAGSTNGNAQMLEMSGNPRHAEQHDMALESSLVGGRSDNYTFAKGERPLWEFGPVSQPVPLGDVAREYRKQKMNAKKAEFVFEKQGS